MLSKVADVAYVTPEEWGDSGGHLSDGIPEGRITDLLEGASRFLDRLLRRSRPLESHTVTINVALTGDRVISLGDDRPPAEQDRWTFTISACTLYDANGTSQGTVSPASIVTLWAASDAYLLLPTSTPGQDGWTARITYTAGYSTIPDALREATIEVARSLVLRDLDQRDPLDLSVAGAAKARAAEIASAYATFAVA